MKPDAQRSAIAASVDLKEPVYTGWGSDKWEDWRPDYLNDLNAMHEAEKLIRADVVLELAYLGHLFSISNNNPFCATAAMRAEAYLKTLNLWKES